MRRAGVVVGIAQGVLIVRSPDTQAPHIGATVVDETLNPVGRVVDVFGPVDRPYLTVSPTSSNGSTEVLGSLVYIRSS